MENPRRAGVGVILFIILLVVGASGAGYYFLQEQTSKEYAAETIAMAVDTTRSLSALERQPSSDGIRDAKRKISTYLERTDATTEAKTAWNEKIAKLEQLLEERSDRLDSLMKSVADFDLESPQSQIDALEAEIAEAVLQLDGNSRNQVKSAWQKRKKQIEDNYRSVSATLVLKSVPSGAKTYLNGEYMGLSWLGLKNVGKGTHTVAFEKAGYTRVETTIEVTESGTIEPEPIELPFETGVLKVTVTGGKKRSEFSVSIEKNAENNQDIILYIDEKFGRETTFENAPSGRLRLSVSEGYSEVAERFIEVKPGVENEVSIDL